MNPGIPADWNWLESQGDYDRYAIGNEESVWICGKCGQQGDPDPDFDDHDCDVA
jgi:hypothetical protein